MLFVEQAVRVDKMRILTSELLCSRVHHIREFIQGTSHFLCESRCHFVCGSDEQCVQTLLHSELLARVYTDTGASEFNTVNSSLGKIHLIVHLELLIGEKSCQYFGYAGGIQMLVNILGVENGPGIRFHQDGAFSTDLRPFRPPFDLVRLDFLILALFRLRVIIGLTASFIFRC